MSERQNMPDIDLIYMEVTPGVRKMGAILKRADGSMLEVPPVPASGAFAPVVAALWPECAVAFATPEDLHNYLAMQHFANMHRKTNRVGQPYPFRLANAST